MTDAAALAIEDLVAGYGQVTVLEAVSLAAKPGTITAVLGANGAGKTTCCGRSAGWSGPARAGS